MIPDFAALNPGYGWHVGAGSHLDFNPIIEYSPTILLNVRGVI